MPIKTGLGKLDSLLKGGLPDCSSVLLLGPPKSGKTLFGIHFLYEGLRKGEYGILVITNNFPEAYIQGFEKLGKMDLILERGLLRFVDCYSVHAGVEKENTMFIVRVRGTSSLTEIGIALSKILKYISKGSKTRLVFDSVSTLMLFNQPNVIAGFIQKLSEKIKHSGASCMFLLEEGMHDEKDVTTLNSLLDVIIHLKIEKNKNLIEVVGLGSSKAIAYIIKNGKIIC